jgi:hypothetical protein
MSDVVILVVAAGFAGMAILALARPRVVLEQFGVDVATVEGRNEVSAVYGGFGVAVAALLAVAALGEPATAEGIVVTVAFALAGMAAGRVFAAMREMPHGAFPVWTYFAIEVVSAAALLLAVWA